MGLTDLHVRTTLHTPHGTWSRAPIRSPCHLSGHNTPAWPKDDSHQSLQRAEDAWLLFFAHSPTSQPQLLHTQTHSNKHMPALQIHAQRKAVATNTSRHRTGPPQMLPKRSMAMPLASLATSDPPRNLNIGRRLRSLRPTESRELTAHWNTRLHDRTIARQSSCFISHSPCVPSIRNNYSDGSASVQSMKAMHTYKASQFSLPLNFHSTHGKMLRCIQFFLLLSASFAPRFSSS